MTALFTLPGQTPLNAGVIVPGATLTFSATGTSTPQNTYTTEALSVANANPVVADANGLFPAIYLDPTLPSYRALLKTAAGVQLALWDGVPSNQGVQQSLTVQSTNPFVLLYDTDGTVNQRKYKLSAAGNVFKLSMFNDAESVETVLLTATSGIVAIPTTATINSETIPTTTSGSFTGTLTGMVAGTTGTVLYRRVGSLCYLYVIAAITGTSNTTAMTMTGLPAACQSTHSHDAPCVVTDNGNLLMACNASVFGGTVTFSLGKTNGVANYLQYLSTNFTNAGIKGIPATWAIVYSVE